MAEGDIPSVEELEAALNELADEDRMEVIVDPETGEKKFKLTAKGEAFAEDAVMSDPESAAFYAQLHANRDDVRDALEDES